MNHNKHIAKNLDKNEQFVYEQAQIYASSIYKKLSRHGLASTTWDDILSDLMLRYYELKPRIDFDDNWKGYIDASFRTAAVGLVSTSYDDRDKNSAVIVLAKGEDSIVKQFAADGAVTSTPTTPGIEDQYDIDEGDIALADRIEVFEVQIKRLCDLLEYEYDSDKIIATAVSLCQRGLIKEPVADKEVRDEIKQIKQMLITKGISPYGLRKGSVAMYDVADVVRDLFEEGVTTTAQIIRRYKEKDLFCNEYSLNVTVQQERRARGLEALAPSDDPPSVRARTRQLYREGWRDLELVKAQLSREHYQVISSAVFSELKRMESDAKKRLEDPDTE